MKEMKTLNGYEVVDTQARSDIETVRSEIPSLTGYATEDYVDTAINNIPTPSGTEYEMIYMGTKSGTVSSAVNFSFTTSNVVYWLVTSRETSSSKYEYTLPVIPGSTYYPGSGITVTTSTDSTLAGTITKDANGHPATVYCWAFRKKD